MIDHGVIALPAGPTVLRLLPPLVITESEIDLGVQAIAPIRLPSEDWRDRPDGSRGRRSNLCADWWPFPRSHATRRRRRRGWSSEMRGAGYERAFVDEAGNAVGEMGDPRTRRERSCCSATSTPCPATFPCASNRRPTATCSSAAAASMPRGRSPPSSPARHDSARRAARDARPPRGRGRRRRRRSGHQQGRALHCGAVRRHDASPIPAACVIGEPSHWQRITLGYKGRLLLDLDRRSADGPHRRTGRERRVDRRRFLELGHRARRALQRRQGQGLRSAEPEPAPLHHGDNEQMHDLVDAQIAWRLPIGFDADAVRRTRSAAGRRPTDPRPPGRHSISASAASSGRGAAIATTRWSAASWPRSAPKTRRRSWDSS